MAFRIFQAELHGSTSDADQLLVRRTVCPDVIIFFKQGKQIREITIPIRMKIKLNSTKQRLKHWNQARNGPSRSQT